MLILLVLYLLIDIGYSFYCIQIRKWANLLLISKIIYHPQRGWYEEAPPRGALSFGRSPEEPLLPEEGPARARLS